MLSGKRQLEARMHAIGKTETMLKHIQVRGVFLAKHKVPRRTGNLGRTIRFGPVSDRHAIIYAGGQLKVGYAAAVEYGHKAFDIVPKPGRKGRNGRPAMLAWGGPRTLGGRLRISGGVQASPTHFARKVHILARGPHPFLVPGLREAAAEEGLGSLVRSWNEAA